MQLRQLLGLLFVLALDLPLLRLEVKDGPPLRVVERGRPVEGAQEEGGGQRGRHQLKTQTKPERTGI